LILERETAIQAFAPEPGFERVGPTSPRLNAVPGNTTAQPLMRAPAGASTSTDVQRHLEVPPPSLAPNLMSIVFGEQPRFKRLRPRTSAVRNRRAARR
jgi:hypothetical protein